MSQFQNDMKKFNEMYKMPVSSVPTLDVGVQAEDRLRAFKNILTEELDEIDEIVEMVATGAPNTMIFTALADLLGDIQVYCASEMAKFGLPLDETLAIIMQSNFSKMGADGKPIYDERGKLQKGPNYWKPEPKLTEMLISKFETNSVDQEV
jgi:predicted HAD superfamily Cof-like phosphohydrolase